MKKVMMVAYEFPPMAGSGIFRTLKFAKYLPDFGYHPFVLTRKIGSNTLRDDSNLEELAGKEITIVREKSLPIDELRGMKGKAIRYVGKKWISPDVQIFWARKACRESVRICRENAISLVYTTSAPISDHFVGLHLKKTMENIHWVADFRDEWTMSPYYRDNRYSADSRRFAASGCGRRINSHNRCGKDCRFRKQGSDKASDFGVLCGVEIPKENYLYCRRRKNQTVRAKKPDEAAGWSVRTMRKVIVKKT